MATPNNVHADAVIAEVASHSAASSEVEGIVAEVAWQDREPASGSEPEAFVLLQDKPLHGGAAVTSVTSQTGPHLSVAFAEDGNEGDLIPFATGDWDTSTGTPDPEPDDVMLRIVKTGSMYNSGEWAWRLENYANDEWVGMDDLRWQHRPENPTEQEFTLAGNPAIVHSFVHKRTIVAWHPGAGIIRLRIRPIGASSWKSLDIDVGNVRVPSSLVGMDMVELADGSLRLFYLYAATGYLSTERELDVWGSTDGGDSWSLVKERVITDVLGAPSYVQDVKVARSGDWLRMELWFNTTPDSGVVSACSSDRAATWQVVSATPDGEDGTTGDGASGWAYDLAAVDDQGTFLRVRRPTGSVLLYELATRDSSWSSIEQTLSGAFSAPSANVRDIWCTYGAGRVFTLVFYDDGAGDAGWSVGSFIIPSNRIADGWDLSGNARDFWARWGFTDWLSWSGGAKFTPKRGHLCWAGDRLLLFTLQRDRDAGSYGGFWLTRFGGPSGRPMRLPMGTDTDAIKFWRLSWMAPLGPPIGPGAASTTPWVQGQAGTSAIVSNIDRMDVEVDASARRSWRHSTTISSLTRHLGDNGVIQWVTAAKPGGRGLDNSRPAINVTELSEPVWGMYAQSGSRHAGVTMTVSVHLWNDGGFALYDAAAATTLYEGAAGTLVGITQGTPYEFRVGLAETDVLERAGIDRQFVELAWAKHEDGAIWSSSGVHTLTSNVFTGTSVEQVEFGVLRDTSKNHDTSWWECAYSSGASGGSQDHIMGSLAQMPFENPGIMRGFDCIPFSQRAAQGTYVRWGGAGGFEGDEYRAKIQWEKGVEQIIGQSPAVHWQSTSADSQQIVLDAEKVGGSGARWQHSAIGFFGGNAKRYEVEYAEDSAFTTPSRFWLDGTRATLHLAAPLGGNLYRVTGSDTALWQDGELAGWYMHAEGANRIAEIEHNAGDVLHLRLDGTASEHGLNAGTTLTLWAPDQMHLYDDYPLGVQVRSATAGLTAVYPRYMRITIEDSSTAGRPYGGAWRLGRLQAGLTLPISVPMAWDTQGDAERPNINLQTMASGKRTAYKRGEPRRTLTGTSVGDVDRWRVAFRSMIKNIAGYGEHPVVICTDDQQLHLSSMYARFIGSTTMANAGWRYNRTTKRWEQVGDLRMQFEQEV